MSLFALVTALALLSQQAVTQHTLTTRTSTFTATQTAATSTNSNVLTFSDTTFTISPTTITRTVGTETFTATTTYYQVASGVGAGLSPNAIGALLVLAPEISPYGRAAASKFNADVSSFAVSYTSAHPAPPILTEAINNLEKALQTGSPPGDPGSYGDSLESALERIQPWQASKRTSELTSLLAPYPPLVTQMLEYLSVAESYYAEQFIVEASLIQKDFSYTPTAHILSAASSYLSVKSGAPTDSTTTMATSSSASESSSTSMVGTGSTPPSTTASTGGAVGTHAAVVAINAGIAAAGIAVLAVL